MLARELDSVVLSEEAIAKLYQLPDVVTLANQIPDVTAIGNLNFSNSAITDNQVVILAAALKANRTVRSLNLIGNLVGDEGAFALADMLSVNTYLQALYLYKNNIGDAGGLEISSSLTQNRHVKTLWIDYNPLSLNAARFMISIVHHNTTLTDFEITDSDDLLEKDDRDGVRILKDRNSKITTIRTQAGAQLVRTSRALIRSNLNLPIELLHHILMREIGEEVFTLYEQAALGSCLLKRSLIGKLIPGSVQFSGAELVRRCVSLNCIA